MAKKFLNLALQGGGAHGAFTWGVLDRILEEKDIEIPGLSGTSAGAMNAAVMVDGYTRGGREGARERLDHFWSEISASGDDSPLRRNAWDKKMYGWNMDKTPAFQIFDLLTRLYSPYQYNQSDYHPIRDVLDKVVDFDLIRERAKIKLFISTTNVNTGKVRVFENNELSADVLLASACLPFLFKAVEIDGQFYWDGGYMGNPSIFPLIYNTDCTDVAIVQINPFNRAKVPESSNEIMQRVNEISFNASLMREMRVIGFVRSVVEEEGLDPKKYKRLNVHIIGNEAEMNKLGYASKLNAEMDFLLHLKDLGRATASEWLETNMGDINSRSTIDFGMFN